MYKIDSFETYQNEGYVLVENKNHIWFLAEFIDGKYHIINDGLLYATNKYVVIDYDGPKIINLETKKVIRSGKHLEEIINDIAIFKDGLIFDLKEQKKISILKDYIVYNVINNYLLLKKVDKYAIFDTETKKFLESKLFDSITISENKEFVLLYLREKDTSILYNLSTKECVKTFIREAVTLEGNFLVTAANEVIDLATLEVVNYTPLSYCEIFGNYAVDIDKSGIRKIINVKSGKICVKETFTDKDIITIKDDYAIVKKNGRLINNFYYLFNLKTGKRKCYFDNILSFLGDNLLRISTDVDYEKVINLNNNQVLVCEEEVSDFYKLGDFLVFKYYSFFDTQFKLFSIKECKYIDFSYDALNSFEELKAINNIYSQDGFNNYAIENNSQEYPRMIDIGLLEKENLFTTIITLNDKQIIISEKSRKLHDEKLLMVLKKIKSEENKVVSLALIERRKKDQMNLEIFKRKQAQELAEFLMAQRVNFQEYEDKLYENINGEITDVLSDVYDVSRKREKN